MLDVPNIVVNCLSISKIISSPVFQRTSPRVCSSAAPASSAPPPPSSWPSPSPPSLPCNVEIKIQVNIHYISYLQVSDPTARIPALVTNSLPNILKIFADILIIIYRNSIMYAPSLYIFSFIYLTAEYEINGRIQLFSSRPPCCDAVSHRPGLMNVVGSSFCGNIVGRAGCTTV